MATQQHPHPRGIVACSLYGDAPKYLRGAVENARLVPLRYPGWQARFYVSQEIPGSVLDELHAHGAETVPMTRREASDGMFWRFLAADDPAACPVIFRDVDSRIGEREVAAVAEWLEGGRRFHIMRDHPHHRWPIMGGMWGLRPGSLPPMPRLIRSWKRRRCWLGYELGIRPGDQVFLRAAVYPIARRDALIHTEYVRFEGETVRPFPRAPRTGELVGQIVEADGAQAAWQSAERDALPGLVDLGPVNSYAPLPRGARLARRLLARARQIA